MNTNNNSIEISSFTFDPSLQDKNLVKMDPTIQKKFVLAEKDGFIKFGMILPNSQTVRLIEKSVDDINDYQLSDTIKIIATLNFSTFPSMDFLDIVRYPILSSMTDDQVVNSNSIPIKMEPTMIKRFVLVENDLGVWFGLIARKDVNIVKIVDKNIDESLEYILSDSIKIVANLHFVTFPSLDFSFENKSINDTFT